MKFSEVIGKLGQEKIEREFSEKLANVFDAIDVLAEMSLKHPEFSTVNQGFYNWLTVRIMNEHPFID